MLPKNWKHQSSKDLIITSRHSNNQIDREHTIRFGKYALFILYTFIMGVACGLTFRQQMNIISISGELPGFIVRLTSFTSKHTSLECQIAVNESEKVVFKPIQTALMPVRTTYFRKWENRNKNPHNEASGLKNPVKSRVFGISNPSWQQIDNNFSYNFEELWSRMNCCKDKTQYSTCCIENTFWK